MSSLTAQRPRVNPIRQRKPLQPVAVRASFVGGAMRSELHDGSAVLSIFDAVTGAEQAYWCRASFGGGGNDAPIDSLSGFRLFKFGTADVYDLPADLSSCDCNDRTFRPERPGGCRHMSALRQALPTVVNTAPAPRPIDRKTERDEITGPEAA